MTTPTGAGPKPSNTREPRGAVQPSSPALRTPDRGVKAPKRPRWRPMFFMPVPPRIRTLDRLGYKAISDRKCRRRPRGCPRLLSRLMLRLTQTRHLYLLNVRARGALVSSFFNDQSLRVHRGRKWRVVGVSKWHTGFTWGALSRTRRIAAFKAKAANKKRKKTSKTAQLVGDMKILQFRATQLGQRRRTSARPRADLEQQLRAINV